MSKIQTGPAVCPFHNNKSNPAPKADAPQEGPGGPQDSTDPAGLAEKLHDERGATIPCPWWRVVINEGLVNVRDDGTVTMKDLRKALKQTGVSFGLREAAILGIKRVAAQMAGTAGGPLGFMHVLAMDSINVLDLPKSSLMHTGDSGTLRGGFHQANLDRLLSYSSDGEKVTLKDLAAANKAQVAADPGDSGHTFGVAEFSILLNVFGRKDEAGDKFLTKEDATTIFKANEFPEDWKKNSVGFVSLGKSIGGMFSAQKNDSPPPPGDSGGPGSTENKSCPFKEGKPFSADEAAKQHGDMMHKE